MRVVDDDPALDVEPGGAREVDLRADADRDDDEVGARAPRRRASRHRRRP